MNLFNNDYDIILKKFNDNILTIKDIKLQYDNALHTKGRLLSKCKMDNTTSIQEDILHNYQLVLRIEREIKNSLIQQENETYILMLELLDKRNILYSKFNDHIRIWELICLLSLPLSIVIFILLSIYFSYWFLLGIVFLPVSVTYVLFKVVHNSVNTYKDRLLYCIENCVILN